MGGLVTMARGKSSSDDRFSSRVPHLHQRVRESIIPGPLPARPLTARVGEALSVAGSPDRYPEGRAPDPARDSMPGVSGEARYASFRDKLTRSLSSVKTRERGPS